MIWFCRFKDRAEAGHVLADALQTEDLVRPVVFGMIRGGIPVAAQVADALDAPLEPLFVRKIGALGRPEVAAAAVVDGATPHIVYNSGVMRETGMSRGDVQLAARQQIAEIARRRHLYIGDRRDMDLTGRDVVLVDDGIATGTSVRAALTALRRRTPRRLILAVPVAPSGALDSLRRHVDRLVCLETPEPFFAVGPHYDSFPQLTDGEVVALLAAAAARRRATHDGVGAGMKSDRASGDSWP